MTQFETKKLYSRFLKTHEGKLHFAAHSHHFWPDVTREAHLQYWDDSALLSDRKWEKIFGEVIPKAQRHIARILNLKDHEQIVFAPNTHELASRLLSLFIGRPSLKILTTSHEFHSWSRQIKRLEEFPQVKIQREDDLTRLKEELKNDYDIFFLSQVFFDSGRALDESTLLSLMHACPEKTLMVIDGYHGFAALPFDFSAFAHRVFYLGGGYKYAQAGEGACFMIVPPGNWRPVQTGWFAEYSELSGQKGELVSYAPKGMAFMGATQDPSGLYRFNAVWDLFQSQGITVAKIHSQIKALQQAFLQQLPTGWTSKLDLKELFEPALTYHGHFLTYEASSTEKAQELENKLFGMGVQIDRRGQRIRFGFGLYQDLSDITDLCQRLQNLADQAP